MRSPRHDKPDLLRQCEGILASVAVEGAYDGDPTCQAAAAGRTGTRLTLDTMRWDHAGAVTARGASPYLTFALAR